MIRNVTPDKEYELWLLLAQANDSVLTARENELSPFDISAIQVGVMFVIAASDAPASITEISNWIPRKHHTLSSLTTRMEKKGLVKKVKNKPRAGMVGVTLTKKGAEIFQRQNEKRKIIQKIVSVLSQDEQETLKSLLRKLRDKANDELVIKREPRFP